MKIGIAGAGLIGRLMAWRLLRCGHAVTLFDRDVVSGEASAARVAAAMLAPFSEMIQAEQVIVGWGLKSLERWPLLLGELAGDAGRTVAFQRRGSVVVAHRADRQLLSQFASTLEQRLADSPWRSEVRPLDVAGLAELEPELTDAFDRGIWLKAEGCLDNWGLLDALAAACDGLGVRWLPGQQVSQVAPGRIVANGCSHSFDAVVDARGFGAAGEYAGLRGVRGEILWVSAPEVKLSRPVRLMHPRYQLYIAPKPGDLYAIGATQIESESTAPVTVRSSLELLSALYSVHTGFAEGHVERSYASCRPAYADNLPRIETADGLIRINGLYRHGYLLAPAVVGSALSHWGCDRGFSPLPLHRLECAAMSARGG